MADSYLTTFKADSTAVRGKVEDSLQTKGLDSGADLVVVARDEEGDGEDSFKFHEYYEYSQIYDVLNNFMG